jgi:hypothetical protein
MSALAAYHPESRADFVNIARILAFSMASLAALGMAVANDLPPAAKMRYFGRANALNRSADQSERIMMQRRREQRANPRAELLAHLRPRPADPEPSPDDAAIDAAVEEAMAAYRATKVSPSAEEPAPRVQTSTPSAPRPFDPQPAQPPIAIRAAIPGQAPTTPYKQSLLQCPRSSAPSNLDLRLDPSLTKVPRLGQQTKNFEQHRSRVERRQGADVEWRRDLHQIAADEIDSAQCPQQSQRLQRG